MKYILHYFPLILLLNLSLFIISNDINKNNKPETIVSLNNVNDKSEKFINPSTENAFFTETFEETEIFTDNKWIKSVQEKYANQDISFEKIYNTISNLAQDKSLVFNQPAKHYGIARKLEKSFKITEKENQLVIQYEVKLTKNLDCGGAYIKLLSTDKNNNLNLINLNDKTPFSIMFGPDKCGHDNKVHFIFRYKNPKNLKFEEKHLKNPPSIKQDTKVHLYTLVINGKTNDFEILIDTESVSKGNLLNDFEPSVIPLKEIDDINDKKPKDWVDEEKIKDPKVKKPSDWDETQPEYITDINAKKPEKWDENASKLIPDPSAVKPEDWSDEDDGIWEAPMIDNPICSTDGCGKWEAPKIKNPLYKGKWIHPLINNPLYKGVWRPRQVPNPDYFEEKNIAQNLEPIGAVAIEVWTMTGGIAFDNFWFGHSLKDAKSFANKTWKLKFNSEKEIEDEINQETANKNRNEKLKQGGFRNTLEVYGLDLITFLHKNIYAVGGTLLSFILLIVFLMSRQSKLNLSDNEAESSKESQVIEETEINETEDNGKVNEEIRSDTAASDEDVHAEEMDKEKEMDLRVSEENNVRQRKRAPKEE